MPALALPATSSARDNSDAPELAYCGQERAQPSPTYPSQHTIKLG